MILPTPLTLWASRLPNYVKAFEVVSGLRLATQLELLSSVRTRLGTLSLDVPGAAAPVRLRNSLSDRSIFWQVLVLKEYDFGAYQQAALVRRRYQEMLDSGGKPVVVDCGANIGLTALWFHWQFPQAGIICVEPDEANLAILRQNIEPYPGITAVHGAVWSRPSRLRIANPGSGSASFRMEEAGADGPGIRGFSMPELIELAGPGHLLAAKIDIEGAEAEVFRGDCEWMRRVPFIAVELHDWLLCGQGTSRSLWARLAEHPFDVIPHGDNVFLFSS
jgi:FkbM family methyltransferase